VLRRKTDVQNTMLNVQNEADVVVITKKCALYVYKYLSIYLLIKIIIDQIMWVSKLSFCVIGLRASNSGK